MKPLTKKNIITLHDVKIHIDRWDMKTIMKTDKIYLSRDILSIQ